MRYDRTVFFCTDSTTYDASTGDYMEGEAVSASRSASVMDTRTETMHLIYGEIRQGSLTVQLQNHYNEPFDYMLIDGVRYKVDYSRKLRVKQTFIVSKVQ